MTMEMLNEIMDAMVRSTMIGICVSFWIMGLAIIWKWFLGVVKRFLHWLNPKWFALKAENTEKK